jgi:autotransporter-associated beta strand protein
MGSQGLLITQQTTPYAGDGIHLNAANELSGPVSGYNLLTLAHENALYRASLVLSGATLKLRSDSDGATFATAQISGGASDTAAVIDVDQKTSAGGTGHVLKLSGDITTSRIPIRVTGSNGYRLEMPGVFRNTNITTTKHPAIYADSANVRMSGGLFDLGPSADTDFTVGGTMATGVNEIAGTVSNAAKLVKSGAATWVLAGNNVHTGTTTVNGGTLLVNGTHVGGATYTVNDSGVLGGTGTIAANVGISSNGTIAAGSADDAGSLIGTLTVGTVSQSATVSFADEAILAVDADGASSDLLSVKGAVSFGASLEDDVSVVVRELGTPTAAGCKIVDAEGGITVAGTLTVTGGETLARCELRDNNTELWLLPPLPLCTLLLVR